ncbi:hypothetical protein ACQ4PT_023990 [Festuca glaucescens]
MFLDERTESRVGGDNVVHKAEDVVNTMLARGFTLGKDVVVKAKAFDDKLDFTSTVGAKVVSIDKKIGMSEKFTMGTSVVNRKVKEMDQKFQVSDKTKSVLSAAEQTVGSARLAIMKNWYIFTSTSWVTSVFSKVAKATTNIDTVTKEKMSSEEQQKGSGSPRGNSYTHIR